MVIAADDARDLGLRSPMTALFAVGTVLGIVVANLSTIRWSVPKALVPLWAWEASGPTNALLGISACEALLQRPPLRYLNMSVYVGGRRTDLLSGEANILGAEAAQCWAFTFIAPLMV